MPATSPRLIKRAILALGNDLLRDDAIALIAVRSLQEKLQRLGIDAIECSVSGLYVIDYLEGYDEVLLVDAMVSGRCSLGTIQQFPLGQLSSVSLALSPHYIALPHALQLAREREVPLPSRLDVIAIEVEDPFTFDESLSPSMTEFLPQLMQAIEEYLCTVWEVLP